jgi:hypothetical protein
MRHYRKLPSPTETSIIDAKLPHRSPSLPLHGSRRCSLGRAGGSSPSQRLQPQHPEREEEGDGQGAGGAAGVEVGTDLITMAWRVLEFLVAVDQEATAA